MRYLSLVLLFALGLTIPCGSYVGTTPQPRSGPVGPQNLTAEQVIEKFLEATGGRAAYTRHSSASILASIETASFTVLGTYEAHFKAPNKIVETVAFGSLARISYGFDGAVGWKATWDQGTRRLFGDELEAVKAQTAITPELRWQETYRPPRIVETRTVFNRDYYVVEFAPKGRNGVPLKRFYDTETFLCNREEVFVETVKGFLPSTITYSDYREVGGVQVPYKIQILTKGLTMVVNVESFKFDTPIDDSKFARPA